MPITVNESGTLYELDEVWSNEGGTLYEQDTVHSNEGGTLYEIHSATKLPSEITWDAVGKSNFSTSNNGFSATISKVTANPPANIGTVNGQFSIKGNVTATVKFWMTALEGHWAILKDGSSIVRKGYTTSASDEQTVDLTTGDYVLQFGSGGGGQDIANYYGYASITIDFSKA